MSVTELKAQAATLSPAEVGELTRFLRGLALRQNPAWRSQVKSALDNPSGMPQEIFEQELANLEKERTVKYRLVIEDQAFQTVLESVPRLRRTLHGILIRLAENPFQEPDM